MLASLFLYALKSSLVLCLLYLAYQLLFRRNTQYKLRRSLLLVMAIGALALPAVEVKTESELLPSEPSVQWVDGLVGIPSGPDSQVDESLFNTVVYDLKAGKYESPGNSLDLPTALGYLYVAGFCVMLVFLMIESGRIGYLIAFGKACNDLDRQAVSHRLVKFPFSFWKWIFVPEDASYPPETWRLIRQHEQVHLRQWHSLDVLLSAFIRCLLWFNPVMHLLHREIKANHESLADEYMLQKVDLSTYSEALLAVCLQTGSLNLGHPFALKSNLSKRIQNMKLSKTTLLKSTLAVLLFTIISFGIFTQTSLYSQDKTANEDDKHEARILERVKNGTIYFGHLAERELIDRHQQVFDKLEALDPGDTLTWVYLKSNRILEYIEEYRPRQETVYFDQFKDEDREEIWNNILNMSPDKTSFTINNVKVSFDEYSEGLRRHVEEDINYLVIIKKKGYYWDQKDSDVYDMKEVDQLPKPVGGLSNFIRSIALEAQLPEGVSKEELPETIDFEFIVRGGGTLTNMNLLTELKGNKKKQKDIYRFFGTIHNKIRSKSASIYNWKRGSKDGEAVDVKMTISIPTKYM